MVGERIPIEFDVTLKQQQLDRDTKDILRKARALDRAFSRLSPKGVSRIDREMKKATLSTNRLEREVRSASSATSNLGRQAQLTAKRFLVYNVIARFFFALANAVQEGTQAFISFDAELNKARQILNPLITDFDEFTKTIFGLAQAFGVTVKEVQAAQEVFIRQGKTQAQVTELTRQSLALAAAAGLDFAQATEAITASLNQFTGQGLLAVDIADKFTAVSIRNAVTADDLAQAIFRAGSAAATVGVEFDNLIGFISAAQEATRRGGRVIGTGLRTIFTRIFRAPSIEAIQELGIEVRKASGEFKNADQLITLLAEKFKTLSQTQQISIASTIAGQRQVATLLALLRNFSGAQSAANDSLLAQGEAARLTRVRQEALSVQIQKITTQFTKFGVAIGDAVSGTIVNDVRGIADTFAAFGTVIERSAPVLNILASSLSTVSLILVAQLLGLGRTNAAFASYRASVQSTKNEVQAFAKSQEGAAAAGNRLQRAFSKVAGPTKQFEADAAQFKLKKLISGEQLLINRLKRVEVGLQGKANALEQAAFVLKTNATAADKANANVQRGILDREKAREQLLKAQLKFKEQIANVGVSTVNLDVLKQEGQQIEKNLASRREELSQIAGSRGAGGGRGREGLARSGIALERDRVLVAKELIQLENQINILKKRGVSDAGLTEIQRARIRQKLEEKIGQARKKTSDLRANASKKEANALKAVVREQINLAKNENQRLRATNQIAAQEAQVAQAKQNVVTIEQEIAALSVFIEQTEQAIKVINLEVESSKLRQKQVDGEISQLEAEQLKLLDAKLKLETAITKQKERSEQQDKRASRAVSTRGGRGTGAAIAVSIGLNAAAQALRDTREEGDRTTEALAQGFESAGSIAVTAMLLPLGPISLALIGLQSIVATIKIVRTLTGSWANEADRLNKTVDNLTNLLRASKTVFSELNSIAAEIQLQGLSITQLSLINEKIAQIKKNFQDIPTREFSRIEGSLRKAIRTNDIDRISELRKELEALAGESIIGKNFIPDEVIENTIAWRDQVAQVRRDLNDPRLLGLLGANAAEARFEDLVDSLEKSRGKLQELREEAGKSTDALISGFLQAADSEQTFGQNLVRLNFSRLADAAAITNQLNEEFLRTKKGFDVTTNSADALKEAIRENAELFERLSSRLDTSFGAITQVQKALRETEETAGRASTAFFTIDNAIDTTTKRFVDFATVLTEEVTGGFDESDISDTIEVLTQSLSKGTRAVRAFTDEQGELSFKIDGIPGVIGPASKAFTTLRNILEESATFVAIAENAFDTFGETQLSNSRVTDLLAQKYITLANSIQATANVLSATTNNIQAAIGLNNELGASFPEKALEVNLQQITALKDRAAGLGGGLNLAINSLKELDESLNATQLTLSTRITDAFFEGGNASIDFRNRIQVAIEIVDEMDGRLQRFEARANSANFGGDQFTTFREGALSLTRELIAIEKLSGAVLGLSSLKEKLLQEDGDLLTNDIALVEKFQNVLQRGFDFKEINLGPDTLGNREELAKEIDRVVQNLSSTFLKNGTDAFGRAGQKIGVALITETQTTLSTGGDTIAKRLDTVLTTVFSKIAEKLREPVDTLRESLTELRNEGVSALSALVDAANTQISTLGQIISRGIIPPENTLTDILVGQFTIATEASEIAIGKIQTRLSELKADRNILATIEEDIKESDKSALGRAERIRKARDAVLAADGKILEQQTKLTAEQRKQQTLLASINQVLLQSIQQVDTSLKNVFDAQKSVISAEQKLFTSRLSFINVEDATLARRLEILKLERDTFEDIRRSVTGIEQTDVGAIGDKIVELSKEAVNAGLKDAASAEFIQTRIKQLQQQLNVEDQIGQLRIKNLQKELDLLNKQGKQISALGLSFVKATDEQQKGIIRAARLTEKFFGGISTGSEGPNTNQVRSSILSFLKTSDEQTRKSVIGQLEQLKAAGGEVAPGVPAAKILGEIGKFIGNALFKNPQIAIAERQEQVQRDILSAQSDSNEISRVQLRVSAATLRAQASLAGAIAQRVVAAGGTGGEALKQVQVTRQSVSQVTSSVDSLIAKQKERAAIIATERRVTDSAAVSNKKFVDATKKADTSLTDGAISMKQFQENALELRTALVEADDAFVEAQQGIVDASNGVRIALGQAASAQADYNIGIAQATRENLLAIGGLQTYRDELLFVTDTYREQIDTLRRVGSTEQQIAALRVQLAQQQLSIFEQQIANVRQNARSLLTQQDAGLQFFQAGQAAAVAASLAEQVGIRPDSVPTSAQQDDLARAILSLPLEIRQDLDRAFSNAPPGQTAGDFGLGQLESIILSSLGGRSDATPDLLALEQQAAQQRIIIAENSTSQLESTRTATIAAFEQLATAREGLLEVKANKDLAQLQLDSLQTELPEQTHLLSEILGGINTLQGSIRNNVSSLAAQTQVVTAAGGSLTGAEVAGLLRAASREKSAMPGGAGLGVFNTSETVLTRAQVGRLRSGSGTPNAIGGTALLASDEVVGLLRDISTRVGELRQKGVTQQITVGIDNNRRVNIEGLAGLQTALQDIIGDRTGDLYTREEAEALEQVVETVLIRLRETGQISAIGT